MKKQLILLITIFTVRFSFGQSWQGTGNPPCPGPQCVTGTTNFLGTDAANNLLVRFGTNGFDRMRIENGLSTIAGGKVSFFETTPPILFTPRARVNIYQSSGLADLRLTTGTRLSLNEGMLMYYDNSNDRGYLGNLTDAPGANLDLGAGWSSILGAPPVRLTCFGRSTSPSVLNTLGGVAIHWDSNLPVNEPGALLHIGNKFNSPLGGLQGKQGWRDWMSVGTFNFAGGLKCPGDPGNSGGGIGTDNMYVGLLYAGGCPNNPNLIGSAPDRYDAVIAWGDDETPGSTAPLAGPDYLRIIFNGGFTGSSAVDNAGAYLGREVMRFDPSSKVGIGNYQNGTNVITNRPARRLEILTDFIGLPTGEPQFRLTYAQANPSIVNTGKFTDFFSTQNGDLNIDPHNNTIATTLLKDRYVGIHTNTPGNSLEINSQLASATTTNGASPTVPSLGAPTGKAGLRFSDLKSTSIPQLNPSASVLSVDANGDIILVPDKTGSVAVGAINAQNGLSMVGTNTVELGGTLLHPTTIDFATNTLFYTNTTGTTTVSHYQRAPTGGTWEYSLGHNNKDGQAAFTQSVTINGLGNNGQGRSLQVRPATSGDALVSLTGESFSITGTPLSGGGITGNVTGLIAITENTASPNGNNTAIVALANGASTTSLSALNIGVKTSAKNSNNNYGFYSEVQGSPPSANEDNGIRVYGYSNNTTTTNIGGNFNVGNGKNVYGLKVYAQNGIATNYGIYTEAAPSSTSTLNYAIYAKATSFITSSVVTLSAGPSYAGYFAGDVVKTGADNFTSDQNLKQNIDTIANAIGIIKQLKPKTFDYKQASYPSMSLPGGKQYGLIAQDVQPILPELINTITHPAQLDSMGNIITPSFTYLSLEYQQLMAIMIKGMQQQERRAEKQDSVIQVMESQIAALTSSVTSCCSSTAVRATSPEEQNQLTVNLSDKDIIVLNQNVPNPFAEQTTITYNVPEKYNFAQIIFSTVEGKIIKAVDITKKGKGQLNVFANDLSTGFYTYTLVVDGKTIDTKKMAKSE